MADEEEEETTVCCSSNHHMSHVFADNKRCREERSKIQKKERLVIVTGMLKLQKLRVT